MTAYAIDAAVAGIILFCAWRGFKNGLIRGVFGIVSLIAAVLIASSAAQVYSSEAKPVLLPFATGIIESTLTDMEENDIRYQAIAHDHNIDDPDFGTAYTALRELGLPEAAAVTLAKQVADKLGEADPVSFFVDTLAEKLTDALSYVAVFGIAFLILAIAFAVVGNLIGFVFSLPGLKLVDKISGTAFGFCKGIIIVYAIAFIARYFGIIAPSLTEETAVLSYLITHNPIADMFGF